MVRTYIALFTGAVSPDEHHSIDIVGNCRQIWAVTAIKGPGLLELLMMRWPLVDTAGSSHFLASKDSCLLWSSVVGGHGLLVRSNPFHFWWWTLPCCHRISSLSLGLFFVYCWWFGFFMTLNWRFIQWDFFHYHQTSLHMDLFSFMMTIWIFLHCKLFIMFY